MCGIFGYATHKPRHKLVDVMAQGLIVDSLRGMCGTGIYGYSTKSEEAIELKRALPGADFVNTRQFDIYKNNAHAINLAIGHNRASTIGAAKDQNCHPFVYDHIALVHNGTLNGYSNLVKDFSHPVDSAYAAYSMAKNGTIHTLERVKGAFVFVWHDMKENTLNIARNGMRDICFISDKEGENLYFASEYQMLAWVLDRNNIDTHGKYRNPAEFTLLSWDLTKPLKTPKIVAFEEYKEPPTKWGSRNNWHHQDAKELEWLGLEYMQWYELKNPTFRLYSETSTQGVIECVMTTPKKEAKECYFRAHGITSAEWEALKDKKIKAQALSTFYDNKAEEHRHCVILRNIRVLEAATKESESKEVSTHRMFRGPYGQWVTKDRWTGLTASGCCYCSDPIQPDDDGKIKWVKMGHTVDPLCPTCSDNKAVLDEISLYADTGPPGSYFDRWSDYYD